MLYNWDFAKKIKCSENEKRSLINLIGNFKKLAEEGRKSGLLALEDRIEEQKDFLTKKGLELVVDGVDPQSIKKILETHIICGDFIGIELLKRCIICDGVLAIQAGDPPRLIQEKLMAFLGEDYYLKAEIVFTPVDYIDYAKIKDIPAKSELTEPIETVIQNYNDQSIQRILRELEIKDLAVFLKFAAGTAQIKIYKNMSKKAVLIILEDLDLIDNTLDKKEIKKSLDKIIAIIKKLESLGEIC